jgi:hypothetical protein
MNVPRFSPALFHPPAAVCPSMHVPLANARFLKLCDALATCRQRCEGRGICFGPPNVGAPTKDSLHGRWNSAALRDFSPVHVRNRVISDQSTRRRRSCHVRFASKADERADNLAKSARCYGCARRGLCEAVNGIVWGKIIFRGGWWRRQNFRTCGPGPRLATGNNRHSHRSGTPAGVSSFGRPFR